MQHNTIIIKTISALVALGVIASAKADAQNAPPARPLTLWYQQPAADSAKPMTEGLPIGNGTLGGLILGGVEKERMVLSEINLWTGSQISTDDYSKMGSYQTLGELTVETADKLAEVKEYCSSLLLVVAAGTDYVGDHSRRYRGNDPHGLIEKRLADAAAKSWDQLKAAHLKDDQALFNRMSVDCGKSAADQHALPTDLRKGKAVQTVDPELEALLRKVASPVIKETCEFLEDRLKELPNGTLVVPNGWSPEHGPENVDGVSYCQEIIWDLFNNYVAATDALDLDQDYGKKIAGLRDRLLVPQIGKWGQLQEWMEDIADPNDGHRHTSHLFAVYPGQQIGSTRTPHLAAAARKSLVARIDAKNAQRIAD